MPANTKQRPTDINEADAMNNLQTLPDRLVQGKKVSTSNYQAFQNPKRLDF